jgi:type IV pilus assembly protein PilC
MRLSFHYPSHLYSWSGWDDQHKKISGEIRAHTLTLAKIELSQQGITVIFIRKKMQTWLRWQPKINKRDIVILLRQLATLLQSGIALSQSLDILLQNQNTQSIQSLLLALKREINAGKTMAQACSTQREYFNSVTCNLLHIAEQTGTLDSFLPRLAHTHEKNLQLRAQLKQALLYPSFVLFMALAITTAIILFVMPRFAEIYANFHTQLPALTLTVIHISHFLQQQYWITAIPFVFYYLAQHSYKKFIPCKHFVDNLILKLPYLGDIIKKVIFTRLTRALASMLSAGLTITHALHLLGEISANHSIQKALRQLHQDINAGQRIHQALQATPLFPPLLLRMIKIGEESGNLEAMLEKVAEFYEGDITSWINSFGQLLEPLIIMILGVLIGGLVIAMYLPIFKLGTVFDG